MGSGCSAAASACGAVVAARLARSALWRCHRAWHLSTSQEISTSAGQKHLAGSRGRLVRSGAALVPGTMVHGGGMGRRGVTRPLSLPVPAGAVMGCGRCGQQQGQRKAAVADRGSGSGNGRCILGLARWCVGRRQLPEERSSRGRRLSRGGRRVSVAMRTPGAPQQPCGRNDLRLPCAQPLRVPTLPPRRLTALARRSHPNPRPQLHPHLTPVPTCTRHPRPRTQPSWPPAARCSCARAPCTARTC